ncbi:MAG: adenylate/guanylate cyclase domain-containing protein [Solirubrobacterales bacterium]
MSISLDSDHDARGRFLADVNRRLFWIGWLANAAGMLVVIAAVGFLLPVFLSDVTATTGLWQLPLVAVAFVLAGLFLGWYSRRSQRAALGWVAEGREPDEREHRLTLGLAFSEVLATGVVWLIGSVLGGLLYGLTESSLGFGAIVVAAGWLGGETTCALYYLLLERALRPLTALALSARLPDRPVAPGVTNRLMFAWSLGTGVPILGVLVVGVAGLTKGGVNPDYVAEACIFLGLVATAVGLLATKIVARSIADPLTSVRGALDRVAGGDLDAQVRVEDASEVGLLQAGFNHMVDGLHERERIRDLFGRQVGQEVARAALQDGARLGGEEREVGALFIDLTGSTSMALAMPPTEVMRLLNRFFRVVIEVVEAEGGFVNKFEGDAALCIFGAPVSCDDPAGEALRAARRLAERLDREVPEIGYGIGVSAGRAVAGNVGSESRFEYTVIGDPVNEAARLCELAKPRPERLLASDAALSRAGEAEVGEWEVGERTVLRGRLEATSLASPRG